MTKLFDEEQNRREFLRSLGRYLILGGLVSTTGVLVAKRVGKPQGCAYPEEERTGRGICQNCVSLSNCNLPSGLRTREEMAE
jgi:hypothetical protein